MHRDVATRGDGDQRAAVARAPTHDAEQQHTPAWQTTPQKIDHDAIASPPNPRVAPSAIQIVQLKFVVLNRRFAGSRLKTRPCPSTKCCA